MGAFALLTHAKCVIETVRKKMKRIDRIGKFFNLFLGILYIPLSLFSWILQMASERTMGATNPLYINLINIFCVIASLIPLLCIAGILLSIVFRRKGCSVFSLVIQFLPLVIFLLNLLLLAVAELLPAVI